MIKRLFSIILMQFLLISSICGQKNALWTWGGPIDPLQEDLKILHYDLSMVFNLEEKKFDAVIEVEFHTPQDLLRLQLIDLYNVHAVFSDQGRLTYTHMEDLLDINLVDGIDKVRIFYSGTPPEASNPPWDGGFVWKKDDEGKHWVGFSCQGEGGKIFMPCFDHPSSEAKYGIDLKITVPKGYFVAANGNLLDTVNQGEQLSFHWSTSYALSNYLINFTIGDLVSKKQWHYSPNGDSVQMVIYLLRSNQPNLDTLMGILERSTRCLEHYFGPFPFPKDKIGIVQTPYLGMEHQTINAYGNDFRYQDVNGLNHDWLLHHELGHEWWGNKVTVSDWADFWLHEGTCTYGDWLYYDYYDSKKAYINHAKNHRLYIQNIKAVRTHDNATTKDAYHQEVYYKGAYMLHSLRFILGDSVFFPMLKDFVLDSTHTYENQVNTQMFVEHVHTYTNRDLSLFFDFFLNQTEVLIVEVIKKKNKSFYQFRNFEGSLPVEFNIDGKTELIELSNTPVSIDGQQIEIDPNQWYLLVEK